MRKHLTKLALAAAALAGLSTSANAFVILTIVDVANPGGALVCNTSVASSGVLPGNCSTSAGFFPYVLGANTSIFTGTISGFSVSTTSGIGTSGITFADLNAATSSVSYSGLGIGTMQIKLEVYDFTQPVGGLKNFSGSASLTSSVASAGDTIKSDFFVDGSNAGLLTNPLSCTAAILTSGNSCSAGSLQWADGPPAQFSMTTIQTYKVAAGGAVNATSSSVVTVPEPATLSLVGLTLLGLGFASRRRSGKA